MKKIVIITNKPEPDYGLFGLLNTLFPECEIHVVPRRVETFEDCMAGCSSDPFKGHTIGGAYDGKYFNYRNTSGCPGPMASHIEFCLGYTSFSFWTSLFSGFNRLPVQVHQRPKP